MLRKTPETGFTLIELLVVISIIGFLSSIVLVALGDARAAARDAQRIAELRQLTVALELYRIDSDENKYPPHYDGSEGGPPVLISSCGGVPTEILTLNSSKRSLLTNI